MVSAAQAENERLLSRIADLEDVELANAQSTTTETVNNERERLQSEITELKIKVARSNINALIKETNNLTAGNFVQ